MGQSRACPGQSESPNQEDGENDVGEDGCEVDDVAGGLDALHGDEEDDDPGGQQAEAHPPTDPVERVDVGGNVQSLAVPDLAEKGTKL